MYLTGSLTHQSARHDALIWSWLLDTTWSLWSRKWQLRQASSSAARDGQCVPQGWQPKSPALLFSVEKIVGLAQGH